MTQARCKEKGIDGIVGDVSERRGVTVVSTPVEASLARARMIGRPFLDPSHKPNSDRLRSLGIPDQEAFGDELVAMAKFNVAADGGGMRRFSGGLGHPNGWWCSAKSKRLLGFEGMTAFDLLQVLETEHSVIRILTEPLTIEFPDRRYTPDFLIERDDGRRELIEAKPDEHGLSNPDYRETLGRTFEVCRRLGWAFRIVLHPEVFKGLQHRTNVERFSDRRFARVQPHHVRIVQALAEATETIEYGKLALHLEPDSMPAGKAVVQALHCRRVLEAPLQKWLHDQRPIRIVQAELIGPDGHRRDAPSEGTIIPASTRPARG